VSRGRESNRLYAVADVDSEREEYAPSDARGRDARSALVDGLNRSRAQTLASDVMDEGSAAELAALQRRARDSRRSGSRHRPSDAGSRPRGQRGSGQPRGAVTRPQSIAPSQRSVGPVAIYGT
jgi:hypothetical protein